MGVLHGEQFMELRRPFPPAATLRTQTRVIDVLDKGKAAVVVLGLTTTDAASGQELCYNEVTTFVRGAGGFGGSTRYGPETPSLRFQRQRAGSASKAKQNLPITMSCCTRFCLEFWNHHRLWSPKSITGVGAPRAPHVPSSHCILRQTLMSLPCHAQPQASAARGGRAAHPAVPPGRRHRGGDDRGQPGGTLPPERRREPAAHRP